jgi:glutamate-ammonia-ligase adenylyltransferase
MRSLERTFRLSRFAARLAQARPELVGELEKRAAAPFGRQEMEAALHGAPPEELGARLRRLRGRVMLTLAHRDLNGLAPLDEVFETMTALADVAIVAAAAEAHRLAAARHGEPAEHEGRPQSLAVAALGKLGGEELNVSSDIDLVFLYGEESETRGPRPVSHREFFGHAGRALIALLSEITAEGQVFRVDMRLRPFGDGPIATSLAALEDYFVTHARAWERYAWLKSRVVVGNADEVAALVEPFVYRRYLDYGLLGSLRELHARIFETAIQRRKADDIKVGPGGIREIEFAVQLFQLVRGGRDRGLRLTSTRQALAALADRGLIEAGQARALSEAYRFLRRLEHRLQYFDDQQTQALPRTPEHQALIAEAMDHPDWESLAGALEHHRAAVQNTFNALFEGAAERHHAPSASIAAWLNDPQSVPDAEGLAEDLGEEGIATPKLAAERLIEFTRSPRYRSMSASLRSKMERLLPQVIAASVAAGAQATTVARMLEILEAIVGREAYVSLLLEYPRVLARAANLVSRSAWVARLFARHPILLDELTRSAASFTDWGEEARRLAADCGAHGEDLERVLEELRHFKQRHFLRLTIADLEGELPVMALSDELTALADTLLEVTLALAARSVVPDAAKIVTPDAARRGSDPGSMDCGSLSPAGTSGMTAGGFIIVGYGKLGGKELGYGSDLDIIFLYDSERVGTDPAQKLAQRVINWVTSYTAAGVLYETDLRLRPDGAKGVLVSSLQGFANYQRTRAWTWEHQALTRARFCAGDPQLGARFEALKDEILATPREPAKLFDDIKAMRRKMRAEQRREASEIKHIEGGVIDLEFCVQALVLAHGPRHPELRENKGNHTLLQRAGKLGLIDAELAAAAGGAYLTFRRRIHEAALNDEDRVIVEADDLREEREAVRKLWAVVL